MACQDGKYHMVTFAYLDCSALLLQGGCVSCRSPVKDGITLDMKLEAPNELLPLNTLIPLEPLVLDIDRFVELILDMMLWLITASLQSRCVSNTFIALTPFPLTSLTPWKMSWPMPTSMATWTSEDCIARSWPTLRATRPGRRVWRTRRCSAVGATQKTSRFRRPWSQWDSSRVCLLENWTS